MLVPCPECEREVSDRAKACPTCGFPIADHLADQRATEDRKRDALTRAAVGEVDCPTCEARGFVMVKAKADDDGPGDAFYWCDHCEHTGRVALYQSSRGYWAVAVNEVDAFVAGATDSEEGIAFLGTDPPDEHRYDQAGPRHGPDS